ncbi:MAG: RNB domain-containing ribonuclease [Microthrixaceae bacterium]
MPAPRRHLRLDDEPLRSALAQLRRDLDVPGPFPDSVAAAAARASDRFSEGRADATHLALVAVDPPGARDLDQAFALEESEDGWVLHYAIADVAAFVVPGDPVDLASRERGSTLYLPDGKAPLHPKDLSEGQGSLLPGQTRCALWWRLAFDPDGEAIGAEVRRATVRVRLATSYEVISDVLAQADGDAPPHGQRPPPSGSAIDLQAPDGDAVARAAERGVDLVQLAQTLRRFGHLRLDRQAERGGVSLALPEQDVEVDGNGDVHLLATPSLPAEEWNAQLSLATGMAAARLMLDGNMGLLRTLPAVESGMLSELKRASSALGHPWPHASGSPTTQYGAWVRSLDPSTPAGAALMLTATKGLRGSGYAAFNGEPPELTTHAAVAAPYAHVTAPLRRLGDRYAAELALAAFEGRPAPQWVLDEFDELPQVLNDANRRASSVDRAVVDLLEAAVLAPRVGEAFPAVVLSQGREGLRVQVTDPPVIADAAGSAEDGAQVRVRLTRADPTKRDVRFEVTHG